MSNTINNQTQVEVKRFEVKVEVRVITALSKFFDNISNQISEEEAIQKETLFLFDSPNVCLIEAVTEEAKRCLSRYVARDCKDRKIPEIQYNTEHSIESKYAIDYFKPIIDLFKATKEESFSIKINSDYPATLENKHFRIILAPKVRDE